MFPESFLYALAFAFVADLVVDLGECGTECSNRASSFFEFAFRVFPILKIWEGILLCEIARQRKDELLPTRLVWQPGKEAVEEVSFRLSFIPRG